MIHPRSRLVRRFGLAALACVLACTGCSSSEEPVHKVMESVLLQLSDFPPSWQSFPAPDDQGDLLADLADCTGVTVHGSSVATVRSGEFRNGNQRITSTGVGFHDNGPSSDRASALGRPNANSCMAKAVRGRVLEAVPGATITASQFSVQSGGVNVAVNWAGSANGTVKVAKDGQQTTVYMTTVFLFGRNFYCDITFLGVGKPVSDFIQRVLIDKVALRAQHT